MRTTQDEKAIFVTRSSMPPYEEYIEAIKPLWDSHWLTNMGKYHIELENELKRYLDVPELSLMVNGHMALEMTIQAFGFPEGSEVITTPFTFISTTHAIVRNHLQPVFCDVKASDGTMDETKIENLITEKTVAILPVHVYGNVCNVEKIQEIAERYNLKVIYDAAHAFGVKYKGKGIGSYGDASVFSFHATKVYNTIEGGAVAFSQHELYEELVVSVGANAKMNEFAAIMGLCNLRHIHSVLAERKKCTKLYKKELEKVEGIHFWTENKYATNNYAYFPILVDEAFPLKRDDLYNCLKQQNICSRKYFYPLTSDQACFKNKYKKMNLDVARELSANIIVLPLYAGMDAGDIERIVDVISKNLKRG